MLYFQDLCCKSCQTVKSNNVPLFGPAHYRVRTENVNANSTNKPNDLPWGPTHYNYQHEMYPYELHIGIPIAEKENSTSKGNILGSTWNFFAKNH